MSGLAMRYRHPWAERESADDFHLASDDRRRIGMLRESRV